jgi:CAAX protease family protein
VSRPAAGTRRGPAGGIPRSGRGITWSAARRGVRSVVRVNPTSAPAVRRPAGDRIPWPRAVALHLLPGVAMTAAYLALRPAARAAGLPTAAAFTLGQLIVLTPLLVGILLYQSYRRTGRVRLLGAVALRARIPTGRLLLILAALLAFAVLLAALLSPVAGYLRQHVWGFLPDGWFVDDDSYRRVARRTALAALALQLVVDGVVNPVAEELYYRGYLMPRLPVPPAVAPVASAALFAVQHLWQPQNWPLIFVLQAAAAGVVMRTRSVRVGVLAHCLANVLGAVILIASLG